MLILASASHARRQLLSQALITHKAIVSGVVENDFDEKAPKDLAEQLSFAKANAVLQMLLSQPKEELPITSILGCDSIFEFQGEVFGKPKNKQEAIERLQRMSSKTGLLHTGHSLFLTSKDSPLSDENSIKSLRKKVISTRISFSELTKTDIEKYVSSGEPMNCAGGFALEGQGALFIERIEGCYSNVIGLSLPWLRKALNLKDS